MLTDSKRDQVICVVFVNIPFPEAADIVTQELK